MSMISIVGSIFNFADFNNSIIEFGLQPFTVYIDDLIWPFIFLGVIALTWGSTKHVSSVLVAILLTFGAFGFKKGFLTALGSQISLLFSLIAVLCVAVLMLGLFLKKKRDW